jgi:hypothetical protein
MRSGRHYAQFTVLGGNDMSFGVIRPDWDVEGKKDDLGDYDDWEKWDDYRLVEDVDGHCLYRTDDGSCLPHHVKWEGMQPAFEPGECIGMLLDLDQGSMSVWKDGKKLGIMQAEGLRGPLCWAVTMADSSARIESAPAPASPTEEELVAAIRWRDARRAASRAS